jgi:uncharacterized protein YdaU (DUF1376 family)
MSNELHTMPLKVERLLSSQRVRMLELDEFGAYVKLLCDAWLNGGYLRADATSNAYAMQRQCGCNAETAERIIKNVVGVFFETAENGQLANKHQLEIYNEVMQKSVISRLKAGKAAAARWSKLTDATSIPQAMHKQCISNANQSQNQSQSQSINTPPTPTGDLVVDEKPVVRFVPPTLEEVTAYCQERNNGIDPEEFVSFYESKGWMIGKNKMKKWRSAVATWEKSRRASATPGRETPSHNADGTPKTLDQQMNDVARNCSGGLGCKERM